MSITASSSSPEAFDQRFRNKLGSACRETIFKNERLLAKCFLDIEAGPAVDFQMALRNTSDALVPVIAKSTSGPITAPAVESASGSGSSDSLAESGDARTDQSDGDSRSPVVVVTTTLTSVFDSAAADLCRLADDHLISCDLPPWVTAVSRQLARVIINLAASDHFEIRWTVAIPTQAQLKRETVAAVKEYRRISCTAQTSRANVNIVPGVLTATTDVQADATHIHSNATAALHQHQQPQPKPVSHASLSVGDASHVDTQLNPTPVCSAFGGYQTYTCPTGIRPLQVKADAAKRPIDQALKQARVFIGHPVHDRLKFEPNHNGAYAKRRVAFADAIERVPCSRQVAAEAVLECLPELVKGTIERSVHPDDIERFGHTIIIYALDHTYLTKLELRSVSAAWDKVSQLPNELVRQYATRFEHCAHIYTALYSTHGLSNRDITAKFADGLRGTREVLGRCLIDPQCQLGYEAYKLALFAFLDNGTSLPDDLTASMSGQSRPQGPSKGGGKKIDHSQIITICALATKELGIPPENCLRCGLPSHQANSCRHRHIFKQSERCGRCGRLRGPEHKCPHKSFKCGRCKRNGHLSGVCRKVITNDSKASIAQTSNSPAVTESSDGSDALKIIHSSVACASSRTTLHEIIGSLPADPVVHLHVGHDAPKTYCPI
ncbi:hypothetical protein FOZ61_010895 [Perkinsus olseni]|uniref:CCHC-type domain-containing protein n=1 Tax=Perkinsus olseni TaxID=32597 RepID=A0A7J6KWM1_PEROL|nr:hypothetical protein FOZ61_010895 [Perkinsus olseni]